MDHRRRKLESYVCLRMFACALTTRRGTLSRPLAPHPHSPYTEHPYFPPSLSFDTDRQLFRRNLKLRLALHFRNPLQSPTSWHLICLFSLRNASSWPSNSKS